MSNLLMNFVTCEKHCDWKFGKKMKPLFNASEKDYIWLKYFETREMGRLLGGPKSEMGFCGISSERSFLIKKNLNLY